MRNRAKCKLCNEIIESFTRDDYVECKCGAICIGGGPDYLKAAFDDPINFLRIDDEGNESPIEYVKIEAGDANEKWNQVKQSDEGKALVDKWKPQKEELLKELDQMLANIEKLPSHAMQLPITHYDFASLLILLSAILRSD